MYCCVSVMKCPNNWFGEVYLSSFLCLKTLTPSFLFYALAFNCELEEQIFVFPNNWNFDNFAERSWRAVSLIIDFRQSCNLPKRWRRRGRVAMTRWQTGLGRCFCERLFLCFRHDWTLTIFLWKIMSLFFRRDWASMMFQWKIMSLF